MATSLPGNQQSALDDLLKDAVRDKNLSRVESCISRGAALDCSVFHQSYGGRYNYSRPLAVYAYECYDPKIFETLAKAGLPLEAKGIDGKTALHRAVIDVNAQAVEQMLKLGASPLSEDASNRTILTDARPAENAMYNEKREKILDLLLAAMPAKDAFNGAAKPAAPVGIEDDMTVMKPISVKKKDGGGLNL
jgi:ankyrin repeat protein